jgi:hypothetical protein
MKFNGPLYYCSECKTVVNNLAGLLFIEPETSKGFCSENCIEDFYSPLITHFEKLEKKIREELSISHEVIRTSMDDKELIESVFGSPGEVWQNKNELGETLFTYIRHYGDYSAVVIASVYNEEASFIFFRTLTRSKAFLEQFRSANRDDRQTPNLDSESDFNEEDFAFMQELESKKSRLLADLLVKRKDDDISFEDFSSYESCFQECLETPDEVFETKDKEGDVFFTYIKSFLQTGNDFFYIITCLKRKDVETPEDVSVFPVLAFPTNDMDLVREFRSGSKLAGIAGPLKN